MESWSLNLGLFVCVLQQRDAWDRFVAETWAPSLEAAFGPSWRGQFGNELAGMLQLAMRQPLPAASLPMTDPSPPAEQSLPCSCHPPHATSSGSSDAACQGRSNCGIGRSDAMLQPGQAPAGGTAPPPDPPHVAHQTAAAAVADQFADAIEQVGASAQSPGTSTPLSADDISGALAEACKLLGIKGPESGLATGALPYLGSLDFSSGFLMGMQFPMLGTPAFASGPMAFPPSLPGVFPPSWPQTSPPFSPSWPSPSICVEPAAPWSGEAAADGMTGLAASEIEAGSSAGASAGRSTGHSSAASSSRARRKRPPPAPLLDSAPLQRPLGAAEADDTSPALQGLAPPPVTKARQPAASRPVAASLPASFASGSAAAPGGSSSMPAPALAPHQLASSLLCKSVVDCMDSLGRSPLHIAAAAGRAEVVQQLLCAGCDPQRCLPLDYRLAPTACPFRIPVSLAPLNACRV